MNYRIQSPTVIPQAEHREQRQIVDASKEPKLIELGKDGRIETAVPIDFEYLKYAYVVTMTRDFADVGNMPMMDMPNTAEDYNAHQYWY